MTARSTRRRRPSPPTVLNAIMIADPNQATKDPVPYTGVQFVAIPEFQGIGTNVGQQIAAALTGQTTVKDALEKSQASTTNVMTQGRLHQVAPPIRATDRSNRGSRTSR